MTDFCIVYHWWNCRGEEVWEDMNNPLLLSIATLRGFNMDIPIYVIDAGSNGRAWREFPQTLNFKVFHTGGPTIPLLPDQSFGLEPQFYRLLSRPFDIDCCLPRVRQDVICSCESDIFWLGNPLPIPGDFMRFNFNLHNSGFYYYSRRDPSAMQFLSLWKHHILKGMADKDHRAKIREAYPHNQFQDEAVMFYLARISPSLVKSISRCYNTVYESDKNFSDYYFDVKNLHFVSAKFPRNRAMIALMVDKFYESIRRVMSREQLSLIFGTNYEKYAGKISLDQLRDNNLSFYRRTIDLRKQSRIEEYRQKI